MSVQRASAATAFVLGRSLAERHAVRAGHADGHALASGQLGGIRRLIVVPCIGSDVIDVALLVVVELREAGVKLGFEGVQVHRIGIEHVLIHFFHVVPAFPHVYLAGVGFLGLPPVPADNVAAHRIADAVGKAVIRIVQLLHPASRPPGVALRIGDDLLPLRGVGIEIRVRGVEARPGTAIDDAVVIRRWVVVAQRFRTLVAPRDVPALGVVVPGSLFHIV